MLSLFTSLAGGALIGAASALLLLSHGKIAGISGITGGVVAPRRGDLDWRLFFLGGLLGGGLLCRLVSPGAFPSASVASPLILIVAGVLVGFGTRLSGGCTSGHGVCGLGRLSGRSLSATLTFMAFGAATVFALRIGGVR